MAKSRWYRPPPEPCPPNPKPEQLIEFLDRLELPNAVLVPCADSWARAIAALPAGWRERFPSSCPSVDAIDTFIDKWQFAQMLQKAELPHPRTALINSYEELVSIPGSCFESRFLKPCSSEGFNARHKAKAFLIQDKDDALRIMNKARLNNINEFPIMLQDYIPGPSTNHYFIDGFVNRFGEITALFARQRIRMYPPLLGNSTLMESIPLTIVDQAIATLKVIFNKLNYRGIFSAEFKLDGRDGLFKIIEVNARPWWFVEFAARCGVDVCQLLYKDALGLDAEPICAYDIGKQCVLIPGDWKVFRKNGNNIGLASWFLTCARAEKVVFAWDDPGPAIAYVSNFFKSQLRKRSRR